MQTGDKVDAHFRKYDSDVILEKMELIGRLLQFTRQMDMLMKNDESIQAVVTAFREERYDVMMT